MKGAFVNTVPYRQSNAFHRYSRSTICPVAGRLALARPAHRYARARIFAVQGWAETRVTLLSREGVNTKQSEGLPGVHFDETPQITGQDLLAIIRGETPDAWVNEIVRTFLGWRQMDNGEWNDELVEPMWKEVYTKGPPNFIGKEGDYSPKTDRPVKLAVQNLSKSIPPEHKQVLKPAMKPLGFSGWKIKDLTPNRTRRAQAVNWIIYWYKVHYPDYTWS